jgi:iron only hydrogenase large subunit-like protein
LFSQFSAKPGQLVAALGKLGFTRVEEVARGADETASHEASEWAEHMAANEPFMTTSCCAAFNERRQKHAAELAPFASKALTPMAYTARSVHRSDPDAVIVFIGPCIAKYKEAFDTHEVDYIVTFEEIDCWLEAMGVDPSQLPDSAMPDDISKEARGFGETRGVSHAVVSKGAAAAPVFIDGLDEVAMKSLKAMAATRHCDGGNLVEVMSCKGGCVGGGCAIRPQKISHGGHGGR